MASKGANGKSVTKNGGRMNDEKKSDASVEKGVPSHSKLTSLDVGAFSVCIELYDVHVRTKVDI